MIRIVFAFLLFLVGIQGASAFYWISFTGEKYGDDRYADGAQLLEGECYAIVWQKSGVTFKGFKADGSPVDSENCQVLEILSGEKGAQILSYEDEESGEEMSFSYCPYYEALIQNWDYKSDGVYSLYALDTRVYRDGQVVVGGVDATGKLVALNAYEKVPLYYYASDSDIPVYDKGDIRVTAVTDNYPLPQECDCEGPTLTESKTDIPADCPVPLFSWISVTNGIATVSVTNTATYLGYGLSMTNDMVKINSTTNFVMDKSGKPLFKQGVGAEPLVWYVDVSACQQGFFKIIRKSVLSD